MENNRKEFIRIQLNRLMATNDTKQKDLALYLGVKDNVISYFCSGARTPNIEQLALIAQYFNVSLDYLFGITETKTVDMDIRAICEYTGLQDNTVKLLNILYNEERENLDFLISFLDYFINSDCFWQVYENYKQCKKLLIKSIALYEKALNSCEKEDFTNLCNEAKTNKKLSDFQCEDIILCFGSVLDSFFELDSFYLDYSEIENKAESYVIKMGFNENVRITAMSKRDDILKEQIFKIVNETEVLKDKKPHNDFENRIFKAFEDGEPDGNNTET